MAFQEHVQQMGAKFIVAHCTAQGGISYGLWQEVARAIAASTGSQLETLAAPIGLGKEATSIQHIKQSSCRLAGDMFQ